MIIVKETSTWVDNTPNHIYFLDDSMSKMLAYSIEGTSEPFYFKKPITISTKNRQFEVLKKVEDVDENVIEVKGSKGDTYYVKKEGDKVTCSCQSFKYRGRCKHIEGV